MHGRGKVPAPSIQGAVARALYALLLEADESRTPSKRAQKRHSFPSRLALNTRYACLLSACALVEAQWLVSTPGDNPEQRQQQPLPPGELAQTHTPAGPTSRRLPRRMRLLLQLRGPRLRRRRRPLGRPQLRLHSERVRLQRVVGARQVGKVGLGLGKQGIGCG